MAVPMWYKDNASSETEPVNLSNVHAHGQMDLWIEEEGKFIEHWVSHHSFYNDYSLSIHLRIRLRSLQMLICALTF